MKKIAFTVAFGSNVYKNMAYCLKKSVNLYSPSVDFKILGEDYYTPFDSNLKDKKLLPKDYKYPKLEIFTKLKDPDVIYMYIDADSFVFGDLNPYFDLIEDDELMIEYCYSGKKGWAGNKDLDFVNACEKAGIKGMKPFSINSGFMIWKNQIKCFEYALDLIKNKTIDDDKGRVGDEYYLCAGLQLAKTKIKPLNYDEVKIGKFWNGKIKYKDKRLICSCYPENDRIIQHYGNNNYFNLEVKKVFKSLDVPYTNKSYYKTFRIWLINLLQSVGIKNTGITKILPF